MSTELIPYSEVEKMGQSVAASGLFGVKTKEQAVALMLVAQAQGLHPATAAMQYHIIQGRPAKKAEAMLADFQAAGGSIKWVTLTDEKVEAEFSHPQGGTVTLDWTIDRAKKAGLTEKEGSMYKKYPRAMLRSRLVSEGVRTIYPAATGGMRAPEEFDETEITHSEGEGPKINGKKSRLENIIDVQNESGQGEAPAAEAQQIEHKEPPKTAKKKEEKPAPSSAPAPKEKLPDGLHIVTGIIEEQPKSNTVTNPKTNEPQIKFAFKIGDKYYGTFDLPMVDEIMKVVDIQQAKRKKGEDMNILVRFHYTERKSGDGKKVFNDIVKFEQVTAENLPI